MTEISAFGLDWHKSQSRAFEDLLIGPLFPFVSIAFEPWDGVNWSRPVQTDDAPIVFCQYPPPLQLLSDRGARLVWIPMWDFIQRFSQHWWNALPKSLRVVAFSDAVYQRSTLAGLPTLRLRYFKDPSKLLPVCWDQGRVLLYWNRMGLYSRQFLTMLCSALHIDTLIYQNRVDRAFSQRAAYKLPSRLGSTVVEEIVDYLSSREEYLERTSKANIYLAPREAEGAGMTFIEALARGAAVFAYDGATMNEYITHGIDGYLFNPTRLKIHLKRLPHIMDRLTGMVLGPERRGLATPITTNQDWDSIGRLDIENIGRRALENHQRGFREWSVQIQGYARFVLDW